MSNPGSFRIEIDVAKSADIAELLDVKSTRVKKLLSELIAEGTVVAEGSNRNRTYRLKS